MSWRRIFIILLLLISSYIFYLISFKYLTLGASLSALSFWSAIWLMIPKRFFDMVWREVKKGKGYKISAILYFAFHVTLYGFFYGVILGYVAYAPVYYASIGFTVPPPPQYFLLWQTENVGVTMFIAGYEADILPFEFFVGIILALLIGANIERILELRSLLMARKKSATLIMVPTLGVVSGTSCCLSLPSILIYLVALDVGIIYDVLPILASFVYYVFAFDFLPLASVLILFFNLKDLNKVILCKK